MRRDGRVQEVVGPRGRSRLRLLCRFAGAARIRRIAGIEASEKRPDPLVSAERRAAAARIVHAILSEPLPKVVNLALFLTRLATSQQIASGTIHALSMSFASARTTAMRARCLGAALVEVINFFDASGTAPLHVYMAVGFDEDGLIVGVSVADDVPPVSSEEAHRSLLLAAELVGELGGELSRGVDGDRTVVGIILDRGFRRGGRGA